MLPDKTSEFTLIERFRSAAMNDPTVLLGIGDDCAALQANGRDWLVAADMLLEGVHFEWSTATPFEVGRKALGVNLSDIAAMAGLPKYAVVSLAIPKSAAAPLATELFAGLNDIASEFGVSIVGGDTNSWNGPLIVNVTILGEAHERGVVKRAGAQAGDAIFVTGSLGCSLLGKHLRVEPRVHEARRLHEEVELHSMLDISDGLVADLYHILEESRVGAQLWADQIPISEAAQQMATRQLSESGSEAQPTGSETRSALDRALGDGEDFELLFTVGQNDVQKVRSLDLGISVTEIGVITEQQVCQIEYDDRVVDLPRVGYCHEVNGGSGFDS